MHPLTEGFPFDDIGIQLLWVQEFAGSGSTNEDCSDLPRKATSVMTNLVVIKIKVPMINPLRGDGAFLDGGGS